jgi:hypothetical protein
MYLFWVIAFVPIITWLVLWAMNKEVVLWEAAVSSGVALLMALIFQCLAVAGMTSDIETWSGEIDHVTFHPEWVEKYRVSHTRTVGSGKNKRTETYYTTHYRTHKEHWTADTTLDTEHEITERFFIETRVKFKDYTTEDGHKSGFYSGDSKVYVSYNRTAYCYPVTKLARWSNRIKAAPSVFSFAPVPTNVAVYPWPENPNWQASDRLLGTARQAVNLFEFDRVNARLGPLKKVNVIMVGFNSDDAKLGQFQQAKWVGGKKNDLVVCFGGETAKKPSWAYVFGWTDKELVKQNLQTLLLSEGVSTAILPKIEEEIRRTYVIKDWSKFDYITLEPPTWSYWVYFSVVGITQVVLFFVFSSNSMAKHGLDYVRQTSRNHDR